MELFIVGIIFAVKAIRDYIVQLKAGKDPGFYASHIEGLKNLECWAWDENAGRSEK
jgi:AGCS family alanine or glycine:cation symporter